MKYEVTERAEILLKEEVKIVRISVRDLVEFVLREGDIDNRKIGMSDKDVMALANDNGYQAEILQAAVPELKIYGLLLVE